MVKKIPIVALVGRTNVGKSSLFNTILNRRENIIAREPGTTRDSIYAKAIHKERQFWLIDTAGMKDPEDDFEFTIQEQIKQATESADIIWVIVEANIPITEDDRKISRIALKSKKPVFLVINKIDKIKDYKVNKFERLGIKTIYCTSTTQKIGINKLLDELAKMIPRASQKEDDKRLRIAILGRPNVGKSQLFNSLAKKQQAIVSDRAGTTRDINRAIVRYYEREVEIMDTAGIRRSGRIEQGVEKFSVIRSISAIEQANICLLLIDANEPIVQLDQKIAGMIKEAGKGLILVISKWDSIGDKDSYTLDAISKQITNSYDFIPWAPLVFTSAISGQNVSRLFDLANEIDLSRQTKIATRSLNQWLKQAIDNHPPAGLKNRNPKLNYIVQERDNNIPAFKIFGAHTKFIHWSYKRYLERSLREEYGFNGTAIQIWFIEKHETHKHGYSPTHTINE